jgi:hypothetical protein
MPSHGRLAADLHEIPEHCRAGDADLSHDDTTPTKNDIVADLDQVIETRTSADHRVSRRPSVDRAVGADLDIIFYYYAPELRDHHWTGSGTGEPKSLLPDPRARINIHPRAQ